MPPPAPEPRRQPPRAFTLIELLVSMSVLVLLVLLVTQLFSSAVNVTTMGSKRIEADEQARVLFDRMAIDFARMVRRTDVDYLLKQPANKQAGNDQFAFYSLVPGYFPSTATGAASSSQSPLSLVAYRINADAHAADYQKVERLGKGLTWNGVSATDSTMLFLPVPLASPLASPLPSPMPAAMPTPAWPQAGSATTPDGNYELMGPQVFRLEYYYLLKGQTVAGTNYPANLSDTPWDARIAGHSSTAGLQDVAAIVVAIAVIDPKSHALVTDAQLAALGAQLDDFTPSNTAGAMEARWQATLNAGVAGVPAAATKWVRIYHQYFYL